MRKMTKTIIAVAAIMAFAGTASAGTNRLTVANGATNAFVVQDSGATTIQNVGEADTVAKFQLKNAAGTPTVQMLGNGQVILNTATTFSPLGTTKIYGLSMTQIMDDFQNSASGGTGILWRFGRGSLASRSIVQNGDRLGYAYFAGYDGAAMQNGGGFAAVVDGTPAAGSVPVAFAFQTGTATATRTERLLISAKGNIVAGNSGSKAAGALAVSATDGFMYIPTVAGGLTSCSTATTYAGHTAIWYDSTNNQMCTCNSGSLKCATFN